MKDFAEFVKKQGVIGFAIGFVLGSAVSNVANSFITNILNPILGIVLGVTKNLDALFFSVGEAKIMYGNFLNSLVQFLTISLIVYLVVRKLEIDEKELEKKTKVKAD